MTLHTRSSLQAKVEAMLAGEAPENDLERFALLRAIAAGAKPAVQFNARAAIQASLVSALQAQAWDSAPEHVKASPALSAVYMQAVAAQIKALPDAKGCSFGAAPKAPVVDGKASTEELEQFERAVLLEPASESPSLVKHAAAIRELEKRVEAEQARPWTERAKGLEEKLAALRQQSPAEARRAELEAKIEAGSYGRLGRLIDSLQPNDRARALVVDRAHRLGCFGKLGLIAKQRIGMRQVAQHETAHPLIQQAPRGTHPHPQVIGEQAKLCYLPVTKTGDQPPAALAEGLGSWQHVELPDRVHGAYLFVPGASAESEAA